MTSPRPAFARRRPLARLPVGGLRKRDVRAFLASACVALGTLVAAPSAMAQEAGSAPGSEGDARADDARPRVALDTNLGTIELALFPERAPRTVDNFLQYVDSGFYDGTVFHRVIEGFMIQGGGFDASLERLETRAPVRNEADNGLGNRRYTIAMARTNAPHSATAQFFVNVADNRNLDHTAATPRGWGYTVFGEVVDGRDVVDAIAEVPTGAGGPFASDVPRTPVVIEGAARVGAAGVAPGDDPGAVPASSPGPASLDTGGAADAGGAAERTLHGLTAPSATAGTD